MKWLMTTITFRYHLYSITKLADIADHCGFHGIELWEPHYFRNELEIRKWLMNHRKGFEMNLSVLSGYVDLTDFSSDAEEWYLRLKQRLHCCQSLRIPILRLFSGNLSYSEASRFDWERWLERLEQIEALAENFGVHVAFEVHPQTLLDNVSGVDTLVEAIEKNNWSHIGINFDIFHVWELGVDPSTCLKQWYPHVKHVHLKNAKKKTKQFIPTNVFHPNGDFTDLVAVGDGIVQVQPVLTYLQERNYADAVTLEWFGYPDLQFLKSEIKYLNQCLLDASL